MDENLKEIETQDLFKIKEELQQSLSDIETEIEVRAKQGILD